MNPKHTSSSTTPLSGNSDEQTEDQDVKCNGATSESNKGFCRGGYIGQGDTHHFVDQHRGDLVVLGPLTAIAVDIASQKDAPALPIPQPLIEWDDEPFIGDEVREGLIAYVAQLIRSCGLWLQTTSR